MSPVYPKSRDTPGYTRGGNGLPLVEVYLGGQIHPAGELLARSVDGLPVRSVLDGEPTLRHTEVESAPEGALSDLAAVGVIPNGRRIRASTPIRTATPIWRN